jgi:hypothetical protein
LNVKKIGLDVDMKSHLIFPLCGAFALCCLAPSVAAAAPGFMTCQIYDGDRNRIFYSAQPVAAGNSLVDNAYEFYLGAVRQSGLIGDIGKSQGNCNWESTRDAAATKGAAFVQHFVKAGANPFPDRFVSDPYLFHISAKPSTSAASAPPTPLAPASEPVAALKPVAAAEAAAALTTKPTVTVSEGSGGICRVEVKSSIGWAEAKMQMADGLMKGMRYILVPTLKAAPGKGPAKGGQVLVHFDMNVISVENTEFDGLGTRLTFPEHTVTGPIDLRITVGSVVLTREALSPSPDGTYQVRMGGGPLETNPAIKAIDKATVIEVLATVAGSKDQMLVYADIPIGTPAERDALTQAALDAVEKRAKSPC